MVGLETPQVAVPLVGGGAYFVAAAVVFWRGGRLGAPLALGVFLAGSGLAGVLNGLGALTTLDPDREGPGLVPFFAWSGGLAGAVAGVGLVAFAWLFPRRPDPAERGLLLFAAGVVVAVLAAGATLVLGQFGGPGFPWTADRVLNVGLGMALGALIAGPMLFAPLAMATRYAKSAARAWDRAVLAWFAAAFSVAPAVFYSGLFMVSAQFAADAVSSIRNGLGLAVVFLVAGVWLHATRGSPGEATRTARNLAVFTVGLVAAGFLVVRLAVATQDVLWRILPAIAAPLIVSVMAVDAVLRQRLLEEAPAEAPPRQVEAPPPG